MSDVTQETIRALISSNEAISQSIKATGETVKTTNETVRELTKSVQELVTTERERVLKDEYQKEVNEKQDEYNAKNDDKWEDWRDTLARAKKFHSLFDNITTKVLGVVTIGLMVLLGFKFS